MIACNFRIISYVNMYENVFCALLNVSFVVHKSQIIKNSLHYLLLVDTRHTDKKMFGIEWHSKRDFNMSW